MKLESRLHNQTTRRERETEALRTALASEKVQSTKETLKNLM
jgi:hypothetical protein